MKYEPRGRTTVRRKDKGECEGCSIGIGGIESILTEFRGHHLCGSCQADWKSLEERKGRRVEFEEYLNGGEKPPMPRNEKIRKSDKSVKELAELYNLSIRTIQRILRESSY